MEENMTPLGATLTLALLFANVLAWVALVVRLVKRRPLVPFAPRGDVPWNGSDLVVLAVAFFAFEAIASGIAIRAGGAVPGEMSPAILAAATAARVAWLLLALAYLLGRTGAYPDELGWDSSRLPADARLGCWTFLVALAPVLAVQLVIVHVLKIPSEHPLLTLVGEEPSVALLALATITAVVVAPLVEELVFRVLIQGWLESKQMLLRERREGIRPETPGFAPLVISSVLFALLHRWPDPVAIFVLSLCLGYVYRQTHRIAPVLVAHACLNGWTMLNVWLLFFARPG